MFPFINGKIKYSSESFDVSVEKGMLEKLYILKVRVIDRDDRFYFGY